MATALATVLMVQRHRSKEAAQKLMGADFEGVVITDRYSAYRWVDPERRQLCWAHLERDFQAMVDRGGRSAGAGLRLQGASDRMFKWWAGTRCGESATAGTCREILTLFVGLWTFVTVEGVEPTNNRAERDLRPAVQMRKLSFGTDSARGSRFFERIMTVVMTLRLHKRALLDWLAEAYEAFRLRRAIPSLLAQPP